MGKSENKKYVIWWGLLGGQWIPVRVFVLDRKLNPINQIPDHGIEIAKQEWDGVLKLLKKRSPDDKIQGVDEIHANLVGAEINIIESRAN